MTEQDYLDMAMRMRSTRCADATHKPPREAEGGYLLATECWSCVATALYAAYSAGLWDASRG